MHAFHINEQLTYSLSLSQKSFSHELWAANVVKTFAYTMCKLATNNQKA